MDGTKSLIRREMRSRRRRLPPAVVQSVGAAVLAHMLEFRFYRRAGTLLTYMSDENEVPTAGLVRRALMEGKHVYLPRLGPDGMSFAAYGPEWPSKPGRLGLQEGAGPPFAGGGCDPVLVLVPLVAWDARGARLGRGGGYYDRTLAALGGDACLVGLGYAFQECTRLPVEPWDVFLHYVATERGVVRCAGEAHSPAARREEERCHVGALRTNCHHRSPGFHSRAGD